MKSFRYTLLVCVFFASGPPNDVKHRRTPNAAFYPVKRVLNYAKLKAEG